MEDIFTTCDEAFVLRDGEFVFHAPISETNEDELISKMVGRDIKHAYPPKNTERNPDIRVSLRGACVGNRVRNVDIDIPVGSVVGIGGLEGQGQRELSRALFGIEPFTSGKYFIDSKEVKITSPRVAIKNKIAFVPDDRKTEGLVLPLSVESNIISLVLDKVSKWSLVKGKAVAREVYEGVEQLNIKIADPKQIIRDISGGNQQKIIFSKWIKTHPRILYLHEPTRGVDVQSKLEIYELIRKLTKTGVSVVIFSSDLLELIGLSDEIYVMYEGEISGHINGNEATEEKIMQLSVRKGTIKEGGIC
jgi:ribose transport system ATP-binding protein